MNTFLQIIISAIAAINPLLVFYMTKNINPRSDYRKLQFDILLVPIERIFKKYELNELSEQQFIEELSNVYYSGFQYTPNMLEKLIVSSVKTKKIDKDLRKECDYFYNQARNRLMVTSDYRNRREENLESLSVLALYFGLFFLPTMFIKIWFPSFSFQSGIVYTTLLYVAIYLFTNLISKYKKSKQNRNA